MRILHSKNLLLNSNSLNKQQTTRVLNRHIRFPNMMTYQTWQILKVIMMATINHKTLKFILNCSSKIHLKDHKLRSKISTTSMRKTNTLITPITITHIKWTFNNYRMMVRIVIKMSRTFSTKAQEAMIQTPILSHNMLSSPHKNKMPRVSCKKWKEKKRKKVSI